MISSKIEPMGSPVYLLACLNNNLKELFSKEQPCLLIYFFCHTQSLNKLLCETGPRHENVNKKESPKQYRKRR
jgi:hypothetical protein